MVKANAPRSVNARRLLSIGSVAASLALPAAAAVAVERTGEDAPAAGTESLLMAQAEGEGQASASGEGEGEGASAGGEGGADGAAPNVAFLRDLGFMTGHLRAGMALYEEGDIEAAKTHMGHPIEEKYGAVADELDRLGYGTLRDDLLALGAATEEAAPAEEIRSMFDAVIAKADAAGAASPASPRERLTALAALGRIAADEYAIGLEGGQLANLHEYQDSWGFLRTIETEAGKLAESENPAAADAANQIIVLVEGLANSYGDLQGEDLRSVDPSVLYGAAGRMEIAALGVR